MKKRSGKQSASSLVAIRFDFKVHLIELRPWLRMGAPAIIQWQRGDKRTGFSKPVRAQRDEGGADENAFKVVIDQTFRVPATLYRERGGPGAPYQRKTAAFSIHEAQADDSAQPKPTALGKASLDLSAFADCAGVLPHALPVQVSKSLGAALGRPELHLTVECVGKKLSKEAAAEEAGAGVYGTGSAGALPRFYPTKLEPLEDAEDTAGSSGDETCYSDAAGSVTGGGGSRLGPLSDHGESDSEHIRAGGAHGAHGGHGGKGSGREHTRKDSGASSGGHENQSSDTETVRRGSGPRRGHAGGYEDQGSSTPGMGMNGGEGEYDEAFGFEQRQGSYGHADRYGDQQRGYEDGYAEEGYGDGYGDEHAAGEEEQDEQQQAEEEQEDEEVEEFETLPPPPPKSPKFRQRSLDGKDPAAGGTSPFGDGLLYGLTSPSSPPGDLFPVNLKKPMPYVGGALDASMKVVGERAGEREEERGGGDAASLEFEWRKVRTEKKLVEEEKRALQTLGDEVQRLRVWAENERARLKKEHAQIEMDKKRGEEERIRREREEAEQMKGAAEAAERRVREERERFEWEQQRVAEEKTHLDEAAASVAEALARAAEAEERARSAERNFGRLPGDLRDAAMADVAVYAVRPEHGGSVRKVHTPARRIARAYAFVRVHEGDERVGAVARVAVTALTLVSKAAADDAARLLFWWSNTVMLREAIASIAPTEANSSSDAPHSANSSSSFPLSDRTSSGSEPDSEPGGGSGPGKRGGRGGKGGGGGAGEGAVGGGGGRESWGSPGAVVAALRRLEEWQHERCLQLVWRKLTKANPFFPPLASLSSPIISPFLLTPLSQLTSPFSLSTLFSSQQPISSHPTPLFLPDAERAPWWSKLVGVERWRAVLHDASFSLCPQRAMGRCCGCLYLLEKQVLEHCLLRLDSAIFNALLRSNPDAPPAEPLADPVTEPAALPFTATGKLTYSHGMHLKYAVCGELTVALLRRILLIFAPDANAPDPVSSTLLQQLNSEVHSESRRGKSTPSTDIAPLPAMPYTPPPSPSVRLLLGSVRLLHLPHAGSSGLALDRGYDSDEELRLVESPADLLSHMLLELERGSSAGAGAAGGGASGGGASGKGGVGRGAAAGGKARVVGHRDGYKSSGYQLLADMWSRQAAGSGSAASSHSSAADTGAW
ncbi:unnamed protein product [Closterium sp. Yama58-4]|nr:unnamed protein product [Closterium sp. Yama58-4]